MGNSDMRWELGQNWAVGELMRYEWRLEKFIRSHPEFGGVCQYHVATLPKGLVEKGIQVIPAVYVNETLTRFNAAFTPMGDIFD